MKRLALEVASMLVNDCWKAALLKLPWRLSTRAIGVKFFEPAGTWTITLRAYPFTFRDSNTDPGEVDRQPGSAEAERASRLPPNVNAATTKTKAVITLKRCRIHDPSHRDDVLLCAADVESSRCEEVMCHCRTIITKDNPNAQLDTERRRSPSQLDQPEIVPFVSRRAPTTFVTGRLRVSHHGPFEMRAQESGSPTGRSGELNQVLSANSVSALPPSRFGVHTGSSPSALGVS